MKIFGIQVPFTKKEIPLFLWFNNPDHITTDCQPSKISLQDGRNPPVFEKIMEGIFGIFTLGFALIFIIAGPSMALFELYGAIDAHLDEESDEPCWPNQKDAIVLSDGDAFCFYSSDSEIYSNFQIADGHYQIEIENNGITEYRWDDNDGIITVAAIELDMFGVEYYSCQQYIRESSLPDSIAGTDLFIHYSIADFQYPGWCNEEPIQDEQEYSETDTIPFEGEMLYDFEVSERLYWIGTTQFTEDNRVNHTNHELFYPYPHFEWPILIMASAFAGVGFFMLSFIDRKRVLTIDGSNNKVRFECLRWPRYGTINLELKEPISYEITKKTRTVTHHEGGDDGSSGRSWTTDHHGVDVVFDLADGGKGALIFLEGTNPQSKFKSLLDLLSSTFKDADGGEIANKELPSEDNWIGPDGTESGPDVSEDWYLTYDGPSPIVEGIYGDNYAVDRGNGAIPIDFYIKKWGIPEGYGATDQEKVWWDQ